VANVLIIQEAGRHKENKHFRECLSMERAFNITGSTATVWGLGHHNYETQPDWESFDLIINLENYDTTGWVPTLRDVQTKKFLWSIDAHVKGIEPYRKTANEGNYDLILQATPEFCDSNSVWFPNCYDDDLIHPYDYQPASQTSRSMPPTRTYPMGFCGNVVNRGPLLAMLVGRLKGGFKHDEFVIGGSMVRAINSYRVHWNANISIDINYRNFETMGCGVALLTSNNPHYDRLGFIDRKNCFIYKNIHHMMELVDELTKKDLRDDDLIASVAKAGLKHVQKNHTYKNRARLILEKYL